MVLIQYHGNENKKKKNKKNKKINRQCLPLPSQMCVRDRKYIFGCFFFFCSFSLFKYLKTFFYWKFVYQDFEQTIWVAQEEFTKCENIVNCFIERLINVHYSSTFEWHDKRKIGNSKIGTFKQYHYNIHRDLKELMNRKPVSFDKLYQIVYCIFHVFQVLHKKRIKYIRSETCFEYVYSCVCLCERPRKPWAVLGKRIN